MTALAKLLASSHSDREAGAGNLIGEADVRAQLQRAQEHLQLWSSVYEQSAEGIMICDSRQRIQTVNAAFEQVTGYCEMEVLGKTPAFLQSGRHERDFYKGLWRSVNSIGSWRGEICNRRKDGELYHEWITIRAVYDYDRNVTHYIGVFSDLTERKQAEASARHLAEYDQLTQLPNRTLLLHRLGQLTAEAHQTGRTLAVLFVDLDGFKDINESLGYQFGDLLLQSVARRICSTLRHLDFVARTSADEFVVLIPDLNESADAATVAGTLLKAISAPLVLQEQNLAISASIGIVLCPGDGVNAEQLIRNAALTVSRVKRDGRNDFRFFTREVNDQAVERVQIQSALRLALQRDELLLHYQPQFDLQTGQMVGIEALVRWNRPGEGMVLPGRFIPIAEECGLISSVDHWVLRRAMRQIKEWDSQGFACIAVAVNISASQFTQPGFVEGIAQELKAQGIEPSRLELELTESIALKDLEAAAETLRQLHEVGIRLSLDDFGTGYCSLTYLSHFPIDKLKIDQSFIRKIEHPQAMRIVRGIIALAKSFQMRVIAEGVETAEQLAALREAGCDEMQGYLACKPLPADELLSFARTWEGFPQG
jgi:diguanylate cyclase (GGDEF)-like protein/PAS domain S-box-containing protein